MFIPWTEIESFHNIRKFMKAYPENLNSNNTVLYRSKVKLHGTNAAVQVVPGGTLIAQSRSSEISVTNDNAGFARWVASHNPMDWHLAEGLVIFGEWCGPGVQKGVAISEIPQKIFAVFAARRLDQSDTLIVEPEELAGLVNGIKDVYVLPWYNEEVLSVDWTLPSEELVASTSIINGWVNAVEENDPWVENTFNVKGTGEGLVFYPVSSEHLGNKNFNNLVFKAKGEKHKNIKTEIGRASCRERV